VPRYPCAAGSPGRAAVRGRGSWGRPCPASYPETIRGHVFCSFLALLLRAELEDRLARRGDAEIEWADLIRDLDRLEEVEIEKDGKRFVLRSQTTGTAGKLFQAARVALPQTVRQVV
jgi:hypothetical protein